MADCLSLIVTFTNGREFTYPIHAGGDWTYRNQPPRVVVRPWGKGLGRHEIPLGNVASVQLVEAPVAAPVTDTELDSANWAAECADFGCHRLHLDGGVCEDDVCTRTHV